MDIRDALLVIVGYLIGSLPMAVIVPRLTGATDRLTGATDRRVGTTDPRADAVRLMATGRLATTVLLDVAKGAMPVLVARQLAAAELVVAIVGVAAVVGACRSVFLRFRGGGGIATGMGALLVIAPLAALVSGPVFVAVWWLSRYASLASLVASATAAVVAAVLVFAGAADPVALLFAVLAAAVIWSAHAASIRRLVRGQEGRSSLGGGVDLFGLLEGVGPGAFDARYLEAIPGSRSYVIAFEERSGSTMLCSLLQKTGKLGRPDEFLNPRGPVQMYVSRSHARDLDQYFGYLRHELSTSNGYFGMKATYPDFAPLIRSGAIGRVLGEVRFIHLTRRDVLRQAVSSALARKRDFWHAYAGKRSLPEDADADAEVDTATVLRVMKRILDERQSWERFFALYGIEPLRVTYEDLVDDRVGSLDAIFRFLGMPIEARTFLAQSETSRLSNDTNDRWLDEVRRRHRL